VKEGRRVSAVGVAIVWVFPSPKLEKQAGIAVPHQKINGHQGLTGEEGGRADFMFRHEGTKGVGTNPFVKKESGSTTPKDTSRNQTKG